MKIQWNALSPEALRGLIEEFVTREGTDYGEIETSLARKVAQIEQQLRAGEADIVYEPATATTPPAINIIPRPHKCSPNRPN